MLCNLAVSYFNSKQRKKAGRNDENIGENGYSGDWLKGPAHSIQGAGRALKIKIEFPRLFSGRWQTKPNGWMCWQNQQLEISSWGVRTGVWEGSSHNAFMFSLKFSSPAHCVTKLSKYWWFQRRDARRLNTVVNGWDLRSCRCLSYQNAQDFLADHQKQKKNKLDRRGRWWWRWDRINVRESLRYVWCKMCWV